METLIKKYKSKLLNHLLWESENEELLEPRERMLFNLHLDCLKEFIKDLEEIK